MNRSRFDFYFISNVCRNKLVTTSLSQHSCRNKPIATRHPQHSFRTAWVRPKILKVE